MICEWIRATVTAEYPCKWGRGAMLIADNGNRYPASAGQLPTNFKLNDRFKIFISGRGIGHLIEAIKIVPNDKNHCCGKYIRTEADRQNHNNVHHKRLNQATK